jgi:hypothetical protein
MIFSSMMEPKMENNQKYPNYLASLDNSEAIL